MFDNVYHIIKLSNLPSGVYETFHEEHFITFQNCSIMIFDVCPTGSFPLPNSSKSQIIMYWVLFD